MSDLLKYYTIACPSDVIRFTVLKDGDRYSMPSLNVAPIGGGDIEFFADNDEWLKEQLHPALQNYENRTMTPADGKVIAEYLSYCKGSPTPGNLIQDTLAILNEAIKEGCL